jgi:hypothetical protein
MPWSKAASPTGGDAFAARMTMSEARIGIFIARTKLMGGAVCHGQLQLADRIIASPDSTVFVAAEIMRSLDHIRACVFQSVDRGSNTGMHRALILPG